MGRRKKITHHFLKLSKEHTIIQEHLDTLAQLLKEPDITGNILDTLEAFCIDLTEHFAMEEEILFPAALMGIRNLDVTDSIILLCKEHGYFERDLAIILEQLHKEDADTPLSRDLKTTLESIIGTLRHHAQRETDDLFRQMDASRECTKLLKGYIV
ncbi:hypothetical protein KAR48_13990 [bacterium]|nr:hypothetical protein [bacterium]